MTQTNLFNFEEKKEMYEAGTTCPAYICEACSEISEYKHNPEFCDKHGN